MLRSLWLLLRPILDENTPSELIWVSPDGWGKPTAESELSPVVGVSSAMTSRTTVSKHTE